MKAVVIKGKGGPEVLHVEDAPRPEPGAGEVLVRVHAAALNRADLLQARGLYPAPPGAPADIPGLEYAGEIAALGPEADGRWRVGDRVFGIVAGGAQAEYLTTHHRMLAAIPGDLRYEEAAAVPEAFITAHDALATQAGMLDDAPETVLIHAVGSGVGLAALQVAKAMGGRVLGTSRSPGKLEDAARFGLDVPILNDSGKFADAVLDATKGEGASVIVDFIGPKALGENLAALAMRGRIVQVGMLAGSKAEVDLGPLMAKRATIIGTTLRARSLEEKTEATQLFAERVCGWLEGGRVEPVVDSVFPLEDVRKAHERMASNETFGKVVLTVA